LRRAETWDLSAWIPTILSRYAINPLFQKTTGRDSFSFIKMSGGVKRSSDLGLSNSVSVTVSILVSSIPESVKARVGRNGSSVRNGAGLLPVVMIAYVQEYSLRYWHRKINEWISELAISAVADTCIWNDSELLEMIDECVPKGHATCRSVHMRTDSTMSSDITIHHLWIAMNRRPEK